MNSTIKRKGPGAGPGLILISALLACGEAAGQDFSAWRSHRDLKLNTSAAGAGIASNLVKYPVPVMLTAANFAFAEAKDDGSDIRFSKPDGSPLPHEIEYWDKTGSLAAVWVLADVAGNSASQAIRMHWGNPAAANISDSKAVFAPADGWGGGLAPGRRRR